jgi:hypothetical protein
MINAPIVDTIEKDDTDQTNPYDIDVSLASLDMKESKHGAKS